MISLLLVQPEVNLITPESWFEEMPRLIEYCGRLAHKSEDKAGDGTAAHFIQKWALKEQHASILEHCCITVKFTMSRSASHQLVRHRIGAFTQESQRYCDYAHERHGNTLSVICPPKVFDFPDKAIAAKVSDSIFLYAPCPEKSDEVECRLFEDVYPERIRTIEMYTWLRSVLVAYEYYLEMRNGGIPAEDARYLLPNATKTEIATTFNIRQWRHVFKLRCDRHAQWEVRSLMKKTLAMFITLLPECFGDEEMRNLL